jgi:RHS repeat-associated protein
MRYPSHTTKMKIKASSSHVFLWGSLLLSLTTGLFADGNRYYLNDHLATTVGTSDAAGEIAALVADAFGAPIAAGQAPSRYTGKSYDDDLGAFVFPFRNYRPEEARWMSADPSGFPDGVNSKSYAAIPNLSIDRDGLYKIEVFSNITSPSQHKVFTIPQGQTTISVSITGNFSLKYNFGGSNGPAATSSESFYYSASLSITNYITGVAIFTGDPAYGQFTVSSDLANGAFVVARTDIPAVTANLGVGSYGMELALFEAWSDTSTLNSGDFKVRE